MDNLSSLVTRMVKRGIETKFPPYSGKAFILALVDRTDPETLGLLFSPGDKRAGGSLDATRYVAVTEAALNDGENFGDLTSFAGRRNGDREYALRGTWDEALIADLSFPNVALVGFSDGSVRELSREELGLEPSDPITVGEGSKSELLRALSNQ